MRREYPKIAICAIIILGILTGFALSFYDLLLALLLSVAVLLKMIKYLLILRKGDSTSV